MIIKKYEKTRKNSAQSTMQPAVYSYCNITVQLVTEKMCTGFKSNRQKRKEEKNKQKKKQKKKEVEEEKEENVQPGYFTVIIIVALTDRELSSVRPSFRLWSHWHFSVFLIFCLYFVKVAEVLLCVYCLFSLYSCIYIFCLVCCGCFIFQCP